MRFQGDVTALPADGLAEAPTGGPDLMHLVTDSDLTARTAGPGSPPLLAIRLPTPAGGPTDPMQGHEIWHAVTDTVVLLGPRSTRMAERLLDHLHPGRLKPLRLRMAAAEVNTPPDSKLGTISAICTLACWPTRRRADLVAGVAASAVEALEHLPVTRTGSTANALRRLVELAERYPQDPLALAPVLLQLRSYPAGARFLVPPGWMHAHLSGTAVGLASVHTELICGGLGPDVVDGTTFVTAIASRRGSDGGEPLPHTLRYAARLAGDLGAHLH